MLKQCFASTVSLAAYFAKTDAEATLIKSVVFSSSLLRSLASVLFVRELLTKQGLPEGRAEVFAAVVSANKRLLRALVGGVGFQFDHIVDVQWRVDYQVKSGSPSFSLFPLVWNLRSVDFRMACRLVPLAPRLYVSCLPWTSCLLFRFY